MDAKGMRGAEWRNRHCNFYRYIENYVYRRVFGGFDCLKIIYILYKEGNRKREVRVERIYEKNKLTGIWSVVRKEKFQ
jgi:hypothetical protein